MVMKTFQILLAVSVLVRYVYPLLCSVETDKCLSYNDRRYFFSSNFKTFSDAKIACELRSGILAEPKTEQEISFLRNLYKALYSSGYESFSRNRVDESGLWIGATKKGGTWIWDTSLETIKTDDWAPNEPNNDGGYEYCVEMYALQDFQWADIYCHAKLMYI